MCRVADYSMTVARNALTYNFPAKLALDTVEVLKRCVNMVVLSSAAIVTVVGDHFVIFYATYLNCASERRAEKMCSA